MTDLESRLRKISVTVDDAVSAGYCGPGILKYLKGKGISYDHFCEHGIDAWTLHCFNDPFVKRVLNKKLGAGYGSE